MPRVTVPLAAQPGKRRRGARMGGHRWRGAWPGWSWPCPARRGEMIEVMTPEQNIHGHAHNALAEAIPMWMALSDRVRVATAIVAAVEPLIRAQERQRFAEAAKDFPEPYRGIVAGVAAGEQVSDCCGAPVDVSAADEGTCCWMCRECGKPCDVAYRRV